jgi:signal transduction histidine kinase
MLEPIIPTEVTLTTAFEAPPTTLLANDTHLTQVLLNLASNSAYAMRESARRELHIRVTREPSTTLRYGAPCDMLRLEVRDSGTGMDAAALARVFDPFFTTKPIGDGTGLGLAVVHGLVSAHDGTIAFESAPGVGTTVLVRLPVHEDASTSSAPMRCAPTTIGPERVLLVDDDAMVLTYVNPRTGGAHGYRLYRSARGPAHRTQP